MAIFDATVSLSSHKHHAGTVPLVRQVRVQSCGAAQTGGAIVVSVISSAAIVGITTTDLGGWSTASDWTDTLVEIPPGAEVETLVWSATFSRASVGPALTNIVFAIELQSDAAGTCRISTNAALGVGSAPQTDQATGLGAVSTIAVVP